MNPLPESPFAFQDRIMSALCEDILDPQAMREGNFPRLDALREVSIQSPTSKERAGAGDCSGVTDER